MRTSGASTSSRSRPARTRRCVARWTTASGATRRSASCGRAAATQMHVSLKEVRLRPKIASHDYEWKRNQALDFLQDGSKVKAVVFFRGREREHPERGRALIDRLAADIGEAGKLEGTPVFESRTMTAVFS